MKKFLSVNYYRLIILLYFDKNTVEISDFEYECYDKYCREEMIICECEILTATDYKCLSPTPLAYINIINKLKKL